jgi:hypothetical protein
VNEANRILRIAPGHSPTKIQERAFEVRSLHSARALASSKPRCARTSRVTLRQAPGILLVEAIREKPDAAHRMPQQPASA